jgi:hypothetical protein
MKRPRSLADTRGLGEGPCRAWMGPLSNQRPLWKFSWSNGEQIYVSSVTGDVVQDTTRASRFWAYLGAIPHWMYFTPL